MSDNGKGASAATDVAPSGAAGLAEPRRMAALARSGLMDGEREGVFDRAVTLASRVLGTPVSLLSLVDAERQFFKAEIGLKGTAAEERGTPLSHSFCRHVVESAEPLVVRDARQDARLSDNPAIHDLDVVAYLGVPVRAPGGEVLGSLCAIVPQPRDWSGTDVSNLADIARGVESEIALRDAVRRAEEERAHFRAVLDELPLGVAVARVPSAAIESINQWGADLLDDRVDASRAQDYRGLGGQHPNGARYGAHEYPLVRSAVSGERIVNEPMLYRRGDGSVIDLEVSAQRIGEDDAFAVATFVDVTDRKRAEGSAEEARAQLLRVLEATEDPILVMDRRWIITYANHAAFDLLTEGRDVVGENVWEAFPDWEGGVVWQAYHDAMRTGVPGKADLVLGDDDVRYEARAFPTEHDLTVFFRDVTAERRFVETRQLLMRELNHRVKNLFSVVSGMIGMTARHARTAPEMAAALRGRVGALARAHDLIRPAITLESVGQSDVSIQNLITSLIEPHLTHQTDRIAIEGPAIVLGANGATHLAMVLHELATNAAKYGSLSVPDGHLAVRWSVNADRMELRWTERDGPSAPEPRGRSGFGSQLIDLSVRSQLRGEIEHHWHEEGLEVAMTLPLARLEA